MQTFLPYPDFYASAQVLDRQRLGKQRVECLQLINTLLSGGGWRNHPAARMWSGYEDALCRYMQEVIDEWVHRGYKNNMIVPKHAADSALPPWFGDAAFHASHRSNLLRKDPIWYGQFGWSERPDLEYVWPTGEAR